MPVTTDELIDKAAGAKAASIQLARASTDLKNRALVAIAGAVRAREHEILAANAQDCAGASPRIEIDRLRLTSGRVAGMAPDHLENLSACVDAWNYSIHQIRPVEHSDKHRRILQAKLFDNVRAHALGGGCRISVDSGFGKTASEFGKLAIFRAKVVAPVADAVGFIDREGRLGQPPDELEKSRGQHSLGRHEDESVSACGETFFSSADRLCAHAAVEGGGGITALAKPVDLIFHQGD